MRSLVAVLLVTLAFGARLDQAALEPEVIPKTHAMALIEDAKVDPEEDSEVIPRTDAMEPIEDPKEDPKEDEPVEDPKEDPEKHSAWDTIPHDEDIDDDIVRSFQKDNCCVCSLNKQWALPRPVNLLRFKLGASCNEHGGHATDLCGPSCGKDWHNRVCWKREYRRGTEKKDGGR